jgi:hypothetical protein
MAYTQSCLIHCLRNAEGRAEAQQSVHCYFLYTAPQVTRLIDIYFLCTAEFFPAGPESVAFYRGPLTPNGNTEGLGLNPGMCAGLAILRYSIANPALCSFSWVSMGVVKSASWCH